MVQLIFIVVLLGIVEGLTEFIPVSSTGHLIVVEGLLRKVFGLELDLPHSFEVAIQLGAILSVLWLFPERFTAVFDRKTGGFRGGRAIMIYALACFPVLALGAGFHHYIKEQLFSVTTVAWALIVGGFLLIWAERVGQPRKNSIDEITPVDAMKIGVVQCLALWPGMSRSGSTIFAGRLLGLDRVVSAEFSFIIAVPVISAAVVYDLYKDVLANGFGGIGYSILGGIVSYFVALKSIRFFIGAMKKVSLIPFAAYRIALGVGLILLFR